jgi:hypothetical protein
MGYGDIKVFTLLESGSPNPGNAVPSYTLYNMTGEVALSGDLTWTDSTALQHLDATSYELFTSNFTAADYLYAPKDGNKRAVKAVNNTVQEVDVYYVGYKIGMAAIVADVSGVPATATACVTLSGDTKTS